MLQALQRIDRKPVA